MEGMRHRGAKTSTTNFDLPKTVEWYMTYFGYREVGWLKKLHE
jgi:hypothetical protein